ncbi:hypothetical protein HZA73_03755 [candidate division TA06 bacterium]|nr:hypothetical protein [candidate division TA06 bacterium]
MALNIRTILHRTSIIYTIGSSAGYLFIFIAKGPYDKASMTLAFCLIAGIILVVVTSKEPWRKKRGPGPEGVAEGSE